MLRKRQWLLRKICKIYYWCKPQLINDLGTGLYLWQAGTIWRRLISRLLAEKWSLYTSGRVESWEKTPPPAREGRFFPPSSQMAAAADCWNLLLCRGSSPVIWSTAPQCPIKVHCNCCVTFRVPREDCTWGVAAEPTNEKSLGNGFAF